jgi:thiamine biosynthesis protein ThiS
MFYVNGQPYEKNPLPKTIEDLINQLDISNRRIVVEHNGHIISHEEYANIPIADRDRIEIVHFVGGG